MGRPFFTPFPIENKQYHRPQGLTLLAFRGYIPLPLMTLKEESLWDPRSSQSKPILRRKENSTSALSPAKLLILKRRKTRIYVIDETKRDLMRKNFIIEEGCRIIDGTTCYPIQMVNCSGIPIRYFLSVSTDFTI